MISLLVSVGCATPSKQQPTTVGPHCNIAWDKTNDPKVIWYQLTVIDQSKQAKKTVRFIPADTTKVSCKAAGASHEGLWDVTVQSCYGKSTCGPPPRSRAFTQYQITSALLSASPALTQDSWVWFA
jgi:hypothetical protein